MRRKFCVLRSTFYVMFSRMMREERKTVTNFMFWNTERRAQGIHWSLALPLLALLWLGFAGMAHANKTDALIKAEQSLERWRTYEAEKLLQPYINDRFPSNRFLYTLARTRFYQGRYQEALKLLRRISKDENKLRQYPMYSAVKAAYKITKDYHVVNSPHFTIAFPPGMDRVLVPYAIQALEKAYKELGDLYGYRSPVRIRVEFLSSALHLADMSPLTEGDIVRTGTIALCKYNRLMITSPRALYRGYRWIDTLVHEFTHLVINRVTAGIPIWLHEGLARYSEAIWRTHTPPRYSPYSETLLARAIKKDKLVPFKKMHPSMAKLPSQEEAALAYAQVYSLIQFFAKKNGRSAIARVLHEVHRGSEVPKAFEKVVQVPFPQYLELWKHDLRQQKLKEYNDLAPEKKILKGHRPEKKKKEKEKEKNFWFRPTSPKELGARFLQLAELLRARKRYQAALIEYLKAETYWKNLQPKLQNKIARTYILIKQPQKAIAHLLDSLKLHPSYVATHVNLGKAHFALKQYKQAAKHFTQAAYINPFHPDIYKHLHVIFRKQGDEKKATQALKNLQLVVNPE